MHEQNLTDDEITTAGTVTMSVDGDDTDGSDGDADGTDGDSDGTDGTDSDGTDSDADAEDPS